MKNRMKNYLKNKKLNLGEGYTLIEVMLVVSIAVLLMTVVLYNYGQFNDRLALSSAAQEFTLQIRQAQSYALNVRDYSSGAGEFNYAYGVYAYTSPGATSYIVFADKNNNGIYNPGTGCGGISTECVQSIPLQNGVTITSVCSVVAGVTTCPASITSYGLHVTFLRPNTDAIINFTNSSNIPTLANQTSAKFRFTSPKGNTLDVGIENSGQINIQ
jgi:type II secretory pathway pseudopilin PulG